MHHPVPVSLVESIGDLDAAAESVRERQRTFLEPPREALALDVLHDEEVHPTLAADVVESADVGMIEARDRARLAVEALAQLGAAGGLRVQDLDGHRAVEPLVPGAIHLAHATCPQRGQDLVRAEVLAGGNAT